jgi:predicted aspartyl protease
LLIAAACAACAASPPSVDTVNAAAAAMADTAVQNYELRDLEAQIVKLPESPERDYFRGMLAARSGWFVEAIAQLTRALPRLRESSPKRTAIALEALATAYRAENQYGDAARAYAELSERYAGQLDRFPEDDAALARILRGSPPQTIAWQGDVRLKTSPNPLGSPVAELAANGVRGSWILDTGANQSLVTRTFAQRLGVTPLPGEASVGSGLTGLKSALRVALLPTLQIGGATLSNVVLLVLDDENLRIGSGPDAYQMDAILGYPVMKALGTVVFTRDTFLAGDAAGANNPGVRMYMRGLTPAIESEVGGRPLLFTLDTGASSTDLSVRYYELFRAQAGSWKTQTVESAGGGGSITHDVYIQPQLVLKTGTTTVTLRDVSIRSVPANAGIDILFGNLGQDFFRSFERVSLNFETMTFAGRLPD